MSCTNEAGVLEEGKVAEGYLAAQVKPVGAAVVAAAASKLPTVQLFTATNSV